MTPSTVMFTTRGMVFRVMKLLKRIQKYYRRVCNSLGGLTVNALLRTDWTDEHFIGKSSKRKKQILSRNVIREELTTFSNMKR